MADPKGDYLFVNLSATETRRRLKGFGHGVRKIQSAGKNRAAVIHTATGEHLAELQAKFADVGFAAHENDLSNPIENDSANDSPVVDEATSPSRRSGRGHESLPP